MLSILIDLLDPAMPTTHSVSQQTRTSHPSYDTASHVWMRPCPRCSSRLEKKLLLKNHGVAVAAGAQE